MLYRPVGDAPQQFGDYIAMRMNANPPHLIIMLADTQSKEKPDVTTADGRDAKLMGMMISEAFDVMNQGE